MFKILLYKKKYWVLILTSYVSFAASQTIYFSANRLDNNKYFYSGVIKKNTLTQNTIYCKKDLIIQRDYFSFGKNNSIQLLQSENYQTRTKLEVKKEKQKIVVKKTTTTSSKKKELKAHEDLVINKTLNIKILKNWELLLNNKEIEFDLLVPSKMTTYRFSIRAQEISHLENKLHLVMYPSSYFLRWLSPTMEFTYNLKTKKIIQYKGLAQIPVDNQRSVMVNINFYHYKKNLNFNCSKIKNTD
jgi:hypothetical protein